MANYPWKMLPPRWEPPKSYLSIPGLLGGNGWGGDGASTTTPPPPAPKAPPPGPPDYNALIAGDPLLQQEEADLSAQGVQSAAQRQAQTQRALINFGDVPDFQNSIAGLGLDPNSPMYRMLFGDVNEMTRNAARDMTNAHLSTGWNLQHQHEMNLGDMMDRLAARGSLRSGGAISALGQENNNYTSAQFKARQELLDYLSGVQTAFAESERGRQGQLAGYMNDAATRQIAEHPYVPPEDPPPPPPPPPPPGPPNPGPPDDRPSSTSPSSSTIPSGPDDRGGALPPRPGAARSLMTLKRDPYGLGNLVNRLNLP